MVPFDPVLIWPQWLYKMKEADESTLLGLMNEMVTFEKHPDGTVGRYEAPEAPWARKKKVLYSFSYTPETFSFLILTKIFYVRLKFSGAHEKLYRIFKISFCTCPFRGSVEIPHQR